jgi:hypothetical protein
VLADIHIAYPFYVTGVGAMVALLIGLVIGRRSLWNALQPATGAARTPRSNGDSRPGDRSIVNGDEASGEAVEAPPSPLTTAVSPELEAGADA